MSTARTAMFPSPADHSFDLIDAAKQGDEEAIDALVRNHLPGLRMFIRARTSPLVSEKESQSDLVQTVCREALECLDHYEWQGEGSFRHWLFGLALNKLRKRHRFYKADKRTPDREAVPAGLTEALPGGQPTASQHAIASETTDRLEAAFERIPEQYREIVLLSRVVGLSHREIAAELGKTEANVKVTLGRALARLMTVMQAIEPDDD